jgi:hypothetical protein
MLNIVKHLIANMHSSIIDPSLSLRMTKDKTIKKEVPKRHLFFYSLQSRK